MAGGSSSNSYSFGTFGKPVTSINELTDYKAFGDHVNAIKILAEEELCRCFRVSVEGYDTSLHADDIRGVLTRHFSRCGDMCDVLNPKDSVCRVVGSTGYMYFRDKAAIEKAVARSQTNVGFPIPRKGLVGGWNVVVKAAPKKVFEFSPDQVAAARRIIKARESECGFGVTGYPTSLSGDDVRRALFTLFSSCGDIMYTSVKDDNRQPGHLRRYGFVSLSGEGALDKAMKLDGSDMGGWNVSLLSSEPPSGTPVYPALRDSDVRDIKANISIGWEGPPGFRRRMAELHSSPTSSGGRTRSSWAAALKASRTRSKIPRLF